MLSQASSVGVVVVPTSCQCGFGWVINETRVTTCCSVITTSIELRVFSRYVWFLVVTSPVEVPRYVGPEWDKRYILKQYIPPKRDQRTKFGARQKSPLSNSTR